MKLRYLTKSRFKIGLECPTKLFYTGKPEYANQKIEDTFLESLAEGGFQVGELAKQYFPGGIEITASDNDQAVNETNELLKRDNVIIFEAAIRYKSLFIRADILIKNKDNIEIIEVKAKSIDLTSDSFINSKNSIDLKWKPYLYDVAFQKYVVIHSFPEYKVSAFLMLADKNALCPTDGLNQKFRILKDNNGRKFVELSKKLSFEDFAEQILCRVNVDECCSIIYSEELKFNEESLSFIDYINMLSQSYVADEKIASFPSDKCGKCEFIATKEEKLKGLKCGFTECFKENLNWSDNDCLDPILYEIWNFRNKNKLIQEGRIKLSEINEDDIKLKSDNKPGISPSQRQWMQVCKAKNNDTSYWIDSENLAKEISSWKYPLHFIDFETTMAAIPFNRGRRPYEGIAFQFSHHVVNEDGSIEHKGEYINIEPSFPNYDFIRKLKSELDKDEGSIFRYSNHENSYLNTIFRQLNEDNSDIPDRDELCQFILTITHSTSNSEEQWEGYRNMIDMCELVKRYFYDPSMKGSNSIKVVLPSILNCSKYLQEKYSKPIYGAEEGIPSLNYKNWLWIEYDENGKVMDPYKLLPKMFQDVSDKDYEILSSSDEIREGGAAMVSYARLQYEDMSEFERDEIKKALLRYCELDTMAMVMIFEGWKDLVNHN